MSAMHIVQMLLLLNCNGRTMGKVEFHRIPEEESKKFDKNQLEMMFYRLIFMIFA